MSSNTKKCYELTVHTRKTLDTQLIKAHGLYITHNNMLVVEKGVLNFAILWNTCNQFILLNFGGKSYGFSTNNMYFQHFFILNYTALQINYIVDMNLSS